MYDVVVLGGGPGGYTAAMRVAQLGGKAAIVELDQLGGTCLNWGCIPTKALVKSAETLRAVREAQQFGVDVGSPRLNFKQVNAYKESVVSKLRQGLKQLMKANKIEVYYGLGELRDTHTVVVSGKNGEKTEVAGRNIIIATGSVPARLPVPGADQEGVITSDQALSLQEVPGSMLVVGGGVIGLELAGIYNGFGSRITVVEMEQFILPPVDREISRRLTPLLKKQGIVIHTGTMVREIKRSDRLVVRLEGKGGGEIEVDKVLLAAGRVPNFREETFDRLGLHHDGRRVVTNERMETNLPGIYAIGDVSGGTMLAHVAAAEGLVAADNCMGKEREFDFRALPAAIFTHPEVGMVGLTEEAAKELYDNVAVSKFAFAGNGKAVTLGAADGILKMIAHVETGQLLGVHIMGAQATELIAEAALAINNRLTAKEVADTIHAHPTLAEALAETAQKLEE